MRAYYKIGDDFGAVLETGGPNSGIEVIKLVVLLDAGVSQEFTPTPEMAAAVLRRLDKESKSEVPASSP